MSNYTKKLRKYLSMEFVMKTIITGKASEKDAGEATKELYKSVGQGIKVFLYCAGLALVVLAFSMK